MDAVRGCGDSPLCPGFKDGGACPTEEVLSASCLLHDGTGIQSSHLFVINNRLKAPTEDEGQEEMFMRIIKSLSLILLVMAVGTTSVYAYDFEKDGIYYNILSSEDRTVEVTYRNYSGDSYSGEIVIPQMVTFEGRTYRVTTIGVLAFYYCNALTSVEMPSVTTIGVQAFLSCRALRSVSMPAVTTIGSGAFYGCSLTSVEMPSVTTIGDRAFYSCRALRSVSMPAVTTIGLNAFFSCDALHSVSMPEVTEIGNWAFRYCSFLRSIDIPASVTTIGEGAFSYCDGLTWVYCHWEQPLECSPGFEKTVLANATLYVPDGCVDAYRTVKPWSEFANIEEGGYSGIANATAPEVVIKVIDGAIVIEGSDSTASAPVVEVYSAGGACVYRGTDSSIGGLGHGIYVVKVGGTVQKVAL